MCLSGNNLASGPGSGYKQRVTILFPVNLWMDCGNSL